MNVYCPRCKSKKPMRKAGVIRLRNGEKQRWECRNKACRAMTINPLRSK